MTTQSLSTLSYAPAMTLFHSRPLRETAALALARVAHALFYLAVLGLCVLLPAALLTWLVRTLLT